MYWVKKALDKVFIVKQKVKDMMLSDEIVDVKEVYNLLNEIIEDMVKSPHFYLRYCDDGPVGMCGQSMDITCNWDKLVLLDEKPNEEGMRELLKGISIGRDNPRFENTWHDSGYYPGNNIIDLRRKSEKENPII